MKKAKPMAKKKAAPAPKKKRGYKSCPSCGKQIGARSAKCKLCGARIAPKKPNTPQKAKTAKGFLSQLQTEKATLQKKIDAIDTLLKSY